MNTQITDNQHVQWTHRLTHLVVWVIVAVLHFGLILATLAALYLLDISGTDTRNFVLVLSSKMGLEPLWQVLSCLGVSVTALLVVYTLAVRRLVAFLVVRKYLFRV